MEHLLSITNEYLTYTEAEAYDLIEDRRKKALVESSSVKYKKATAKKTEHYIVQIKERISVADDYILMEGE